MFKNFNNKLQIMYKAERNQTNCNGKSKSITPNIVDGESTTSSITSSSSHNQDPTWVHEIFQGILTSETRCLNCEEVGVLQITILLN